MKSLAKKITNIPLFLIIIFAAICLQAIGRYYASRYLVLGNYFYSMWVILRIIIPVFLLMLMRIPVSELGLGFPVIDKKFLRNLIILLLLLCLAFAGIYFFKEYFQSYSGSFHASNYSRLSRFANFMIFTSSTLTGWEFLHRCFLLMGLVYLFTRREKLDWELAVKLSIGVVWIFEVVFHFIKPGLEAFGMIIGSPILSYLAIRTKSIWIPFFAHLLVEILFILSLLYQY